MEARRESEAAYFGRFAAACRSNDPSAVMRSLNEWLNLISQPGRLETLDGLAREWGDDELRVAAARLSRTLYGSAAPDGPWSARALLRAVTRVRRIRLQRQASAASKTLPPLNP